MTALPSKELYRMFLLCDWWRDLSRRKRMAIGRCERCGSRRHLQSHHRRYPENWFDTQESDLEVVCRDCHEIEHGLKKPVPLFRINAAGVLLGPGDADLSTVPGLHRSLAAGLIDRATFRKYRKMIGWSRRPKNGKRSRKRRRMAKEARRKQRLNWSF